MKDAYNIRGFGEKLLWSCGLLLAAILVFEPQGHAQHSPYRFEVVSIRETITMSENAQLTRDLYAKGANPVPRPIYTISGNRLDSDGYLTAELVANAYGISRVFLTGPSWIQEARFSIHALMPAGAGKDDVPEMLRAMLEERFHLSVSHESRLNSGFNLVKGKGPLRLNSPRSQDVSVCQPWVDFPNQPGVKRCISGSVRSPDYVNAVNGGIYGPKTTTGPSGSSKTEFFSADMTQLATYVQGFLTSANGSNISGDTPVHDATGIDGKWDFVFEPNFGTSSPADRSAPSPNSAIDGYLIALEKLGLKLESTKIPVEFLRIDHIDRNPTEN